MSHSCRALVFATTLVVLGTAACSKQKTPESPAPEGAAADAGTTTAPAAAAPVSPAVAPAPAGDVAAAETLFVRGPLADCQGEAPRKCLVVRGSESEPWRNLFAPIEGFSHDPAFDYELRVEVTRIEGAPADAPSLRYRLIEVVSRKPAAL